MGDVAVAMSTFYIQSMVFSKEQHMVQHATIII